MIVSCAWAGGSGNNYQSLLWSRIFQGVALAPFEALVNACVGDLFFVHVSYRQLLGSASWHTNTVRKERGKRMALSNVALFGAAFLTPVLAGKITHSLGWQWTFFLLAIFTAAALPLTIFLVPETAFRRPEHVDSDSESFLGRRTETGVNDPAQNDDCTVWKEGGGGQQQKYASTSNLDSSAVSSFNGPSREAETPPKVSYLQSLRPFNGRKSDENFFKLLLRPFPLFFHPAILWVSFLPHHSPVGLCD